MRRRLLPASPQKLVIDLTQQLEVVSTPPELPPGWQVDVAHQVADNAPFGGDFLVPALTRGGAWLELVLADITGKGLQAGVRALMLAGAISGLLGAVPVPDVMAAVNSHVLRQGWLDGFVTAAHVAVELSTGRYYLTVAGHPPVVHFDAGSAKWSLSSASGPALGVVDGVEWPTETGTLRSGDALLLYTDGCVEQRGADLSMGIDRLVGYAEHLVVGGFRRGATRLLAQVPMSGRDDREIVLLWRS